MIPKFLKSKTINLNVLYAGIATALTHAGILIPDPYIILGQTLLNIIMRIVTKEPLSAK